MKRSPAALFTLVAVAFSVLLAANPCFSAAKNIWPMEFSLSSESASIADAEGTARQTFQYISGTGGAATFAAPVSLPAGSFVTRFGFYAYSATLTTVRARLYRLRIGTSELLGEIEQVGSYIPQWIMGDLPSPHVVQAGWRYWIEIYISSGGVIVYGAKIKYTP